MSSDGSVMSSVSRIRQFGLYRSIDARTEEFLRASRKRQIRQGCACAAVSTAITVTVVVVVLLIYEYTIAVEWNLVQSKEHIDRRNDVMGDAPFADRLDRSYFGFDQDYFERMPLLINSLQENSYFDPILEMSRTRKFNKTITSTTVKPKSYIYNSIRRTSPRPFFFEHRSPTSLPFSKMYGSRSWIDSYRNEERLKNIRQIIKYLEKTINAKVADMQTKPPKNHIAFTGVYIEPMLENKDIGNDSESPSDLQQKSSNYANKFKTNHQADPLFSFKPEKPGDVNLLADDFLRFAPIQTQNLKESSQFTVSPLPIPFHSRNCNGNKCEENEKNSLQQSSSEIVKTDTPPLSTTKSFSVMLNLFPIRPTVSIENKKITPTTQSLNNIFLTTSRPKFLFKRKSAPFRRNPLYKMPRYLSTHTIVREKVENNDVENNNKKMETTTENIKGTQMIVHVKVYSLDKNTDIKNSTDRSDEIVPFTPSNPYTIRAPIELSTSHIEDHHYGSSGYLPVEIETNTPSIPELLPFFDTATETSFNPTLPEVIKFSHEDAKVPDEYIEFQKINNKQNIVINRRYSGGNKPNTLFDKLRNEFVTTTDIPNTVSAAETKDIDQSTTNWTFVPQLNGHYRSINQRDDVNVSPKNDRKKRLEMSVSGIQSYVPMYTVIKRNITKNLDDD